MHWQPIATALYWPESSDWDSITAGNWLSHLKRWWAVGHDYEDNGPTHWMELPEPPKD